MAVEAVLARAPYASAPGRSRGRLHPEPVSATRNVFRRDCDRIIHATAFRRLAHKTQVFVFHEGDHFRTRLTHTLEVAQIARSLARALGLDEDLAEALAPRHDLGHPPLAAGSPIGPYRERGLPHAIALHGRTQDLELWSFASAEAQIAAIADDIAYDAHDMDDGLRAGLFAVEDLAEVPLIRDILRQIRKEHPTLDPSRLVHELGRPLITRMIEDGIAQTRARLRALAPRSAGDVRHAAHPVGAFSSAMAEADRAIKGFLYPRMYRHDRIMRIMGDAEGLVCALFARYLEQPDDLPAEWAQIVDSGDPAARPRHIADFIAGMTDRYALMEHARLFDSTPELR